MPYTFVFDFDATITKTESLPVLAALLGKEAELASRTQQAMQSEAPFAPDFLERLALLEALPLCEAQKAVRDLPVFEKIVAFILAHKKNCLIVTGNLDLYLTLFLQKIGMEGRCISSVATEKNGRISVVEKVLDKKDAVRTLPRPFVCIGDGSNDVAMVEQADIGIAFGGVHEVPPRLRAVAQYHFTEETALCAFLETLSAESEGST